MRFAALATDYDETLAHDGVAAEETIAAIERVRSSGRKALLVTGRELDDLISIFPALEHFDLVVAENGAVLFDPKTRETTLLAELPPKEFIDELQRRNVNPLHVGRVIVSTWVPQKDKVLQTITDLELELQMIFNKGALMILPSGVNKAFGLKAALRHLGISRHNTVAVGDAENDHTLLDYCECGVAVANALPSLKERADFVTAGECGRGVIELAQQLFNEDLAGIADRGRVPPVLLGRNLEEDVAFPVYGSNLLIVGSPGSGKSKLIIGMIEKLLDREYQVCIIDPEGDYEQLAQAMVLGEAKRAPTVDETLANFATAENSIVIDMLSVEFQHRPEYFRTLFEKLQELRGRIGRPHWFVIDEAHHFFPSSNDRQFSTSVADLLNTVLVTTSPELMHRSVLRQVQSVAAVGSNASETLRIFAKQNGIAEPAKIPSPPKRGEAILWRIGSDPVGFSIDPSKTHHVRHRRKYAAGDVSAERHFFFRGPDDKLNLRAQNLITFMQIAEGLDEETWLFHLRQQDYSRWFQEGIRNEELAAEARQVEQDPLLSASESLARLKTAISKRYTLPA